MYIITTGEIEENRQLKILSTDVYPEDALESVKRLARNRTDMQIENFRAYRVEPVDLVIERVIKIS